MIFVHLFYYDHGLVFYYYHILTTILFFFFKMIRPPPRSTLFPYTPLSRSTPGTSPHVPEALDRGGGPSEGGRGRGGWHKAGGGGSGDPSWSGSSGRPWCRTPASR